jgi:hypothetical protein
MSRIKNGKTRRGSRPRSRNKKPKNETMREELGTDEEREARKAKEIPPPPVIPMTMVESSNIGAIGYDSDTKTLRVLFGTRCYDYADVPPEIHAALMESDSKGSFVARQIKSGFVCTPVVAPPS